MQALDLLLVSSKYFSITAIAVVLKDFFISLSRYNTEKGTYIKIVFTSTQKYNSVNKITT